MRAFIRYFQVLLLNFLNLFLLIYYHRYRLNYYLIQYIHFKLIDIIILFASLLIINQKFIFLLLILNIVIKVVKYIKLNYLEFIFI